VNERAFMLGPPHHRAILRHGDANGRHLQFVQQFRDGTGASAFDFPIQSNAMRSTFRRHIIAF
jgi:hypothetical protein